MPSESGHTYVQLTLEDWQVTTSDYNEACRNVHTTGRTMVHAVTVPGQGHCTEGLSVPGMPETTVKSSLQKMGPQECM